MKTKKIIISLLAMFLTFSINSISSINVFASETSIWNGAGTENDPYLINDKKQLKELANQINSVEGNKQYSKKHFKLTANIDLENELWIPIGVAVNEGGGFKSFFDGDGHSIKGLNVNGAYQNAGLFGYVREGGVKNLIVDGSVTSNPTNASSAGNFGGIIGVLELGTIENCFANVKVTGSTDGTNSAYVGGLVGCAGFDGKVINSASSGKVTCTVSMYGYTGGLVGYATGKIEITDCYATGDVSSPTYFAGGLVGCTYKSNNRAPVIKNCFATGNVSGNAANKGGVVGNLSVGEIKDTVFWNKDHISKGVGAIETGQINNSIGLTTAEMTSEDTLTNGAMKNIGNKFTKRESDSENTYYPELAVFADNSESATLSQQSVALEKPEPEASFPTDLKATFGQNLGNISLSSGSGNGTFSWESGNDTSVGSAGSNQFTMVFTPNDSSYKVLKRTMTIKVSKSPQNAPSQLTALDKTETSITLKTIPGAEYSINGTEWQDSPIFNNLTSDTEYTFYARLKETSNYFASSQIKSTLIKTLLPQKHNIVDDITGIKVEYEDGSAFDKDISLIVTPKSAEEMKKNQNNVNKVAKGSSIVGLYDISLLKNGVKVQPNKKIEITFTLTNEMKAMTDLQVIYIDDNGNVSIIPSQLTNDKLVFVIDHFSNYGVIGKEKLTNPIQPEISNKPNGGSESIPNSPQTSDTLNAALYMTILTVFGYVIVFNAKKKKKTIK